MIDVLEKLVASGQGIFDRVIVGDDALQNLQATIGTGAILCIAYPTAKVSCELGKAEQVNIAWRVMKASRLSESVAAETNVLAECEALADRMARSLQCNGMQLDAYSKQVRVLIFDNQLTGIEVVATINQ